MGGGGGLIETRYFNPLGEMKQISNFQLPSNVRALNPYYGSVIVSEKRFFILGKTGSSYRETKFPEVLVYNFSGELKKRHSGAALIAHSRDFYILWKMETGDEDRSFLEIHGPSEENIRKITLPSRSFVVRGRVSADEQEFIYLRLDFSSSQNRYENITLQKITLGTGAAVSTATSGFITNINFVENARFIGDYLVFALNGGVMELVSIEASFRTGSIAKTKTVVRQMAEDTYSAWDPGIQVGKYVYGGAMIPSRLRVDRYLSEEYLGSRGNFPNRDSVPQWSNFEDGEFILMGKRHWLLRRPIESTFVWNPLWREDSYWTNRATVLENFGPRYSRFSSDRVEKTSVPKITSYIDPYGEEYNGFSIIPLAISSSRENPLIKLFGENIGDKNDINNSRVSSILISSDGDILYDQGIYERWKIFHGRPRSERYNNLYYPHYCFHYHKSKFVVLEDRMVRIFENPIYIDGVND